MELVWLGHSSFRMRGKEVTLVTDPPAPTTGYSLSRITADLVTVSHDHPGHNYLKGVGGEPHVVNGPGEYEIQTVLITGVRTFHDKECGAKLGRNTAYLITVDDVTFCHLGDLGDVLDDKALEELAGADVLLIPVGGGNSLDAKQAVEVVSQLEPKIVVPMHFATPQHKAGEQPLDPVERFFQEMGIDVPEPLPKLMITPASLPAAQQVVLLSIRGG